MQDGEQPVSDSNVAAAGLEAAAPAEEPQAAAEPTLEEQLSSAKAQAAENFDGKMPLCCDRRCLCTQTSL